MKNRNSGLGCGCSGGSDESGGLGYLTPEVFVPPAQATVKYALSPMTATLTTGRAASGATTVSPAQVWLMYFREGMAFGVAWTASLEQGRTIPAQWHHDLERVAQTIGVPLSPAGEIGSNRSAFVSGFDFGVRIAMERRTSFRAPNGRVYALDFLRTQGTVAANTLFGQTRPAVLPAAGPRERYIALRNEAARTGALISLDRVSRSSVALPWLAYLSGDTNLVPSALDPYTVVSILKAVDQTLQRLRFAREQTAWRSGNLSTSTPSQQEIYLDALYQVRN